MSANRAKSTGGRRRMGLTLLFGVTVLVLNVPGRSQCPDPIPTCDSAIWADQCGRWDPVINFPPGPNGEGYNHAVVAMGMHPTLMHETDVVLLIRASNDKVVRFFPETGTQSPVHSIVNGLILDCSVHVQLPDGRIGFIGASASNSFIIYNPMATVNPDGSCGNCWQVRADSGWRRYYPSAVSMANGNVIAVSGPVGGTDPYPATPQVYDTYQNTWMSLDRARHCYYGGAPCSGALAPADSLYLYWYAHLYGMPDGRIAYVGGPQAALLLGPLAPTADYAWALDATSPSDPQGSTSRWLPITVDKRISTVSSLIRRDRGVGVPTWKIMKLGGADAAGENSDAHPYDLGLDGASQSWHQLPLPYNCWNAAHDNYQTNYLVVLPTGATLSLGGQDTPELYDPVSGWQTVAGMPKIPGTTTTRGWHSEAMLLLDGRVFIAGGQPETQIVSPTGQIYNPPYLYRNCDGQGNCEFIDRSHPARPVIASAPALIATGNTFYASVTPGQGASSINKACLIRPGSPTHSLDVEQRYIELEPPCPPGQQCIEFSGPTPSFMAPAMSEEAPPGDYMFFVVNDQGVPSVGKFVRVWGIVGSSVKVVPIQSCSSFSLDVSWLTSNQSAWAVMDQVDIYPPGTTCGTEPAPYTQQALPPNPNDRRSHRVVCPVPCQQGLWCFVVRSFRDGTESKIQFEYLNTEECWTQTTEVPVVVDASMAAWSESYPQPDSLTLHFYFEATQCATETEVLYRLYGTAEWDTLACATPSESCIFNADRSYEVTTTYPACQTIRFQWCARAKNWNGWSPDYSAIKNIKVYCITEGP
jgi:Galactose oxidase-like, Early set domain